MEQDSDRLMLVIQESAKSEAKRAKKIRKGEIMPRNRKIKRHNPTVGKLWRKKLE